MKRISLATSLVVVAFIGVMAIATASASATVLCNAAPSNHYCGPEHYYPAFTEIDAELAPGTELIFHANSGIALAKCSQSEIDFAPYQAGGLDKQVLYGIETFSLASCSKPMTVEDATGGAIEWIEGTHNGEMWMDLWLNVDLSKAIGCKSTYRLDGTGELIGGGLFSGPPQMVWDKAEMVRTAGNCMEKARFSATYNITSPTPFFIEKY